MYQVKRFEVFSEPLLLPACKDTEPHAEELLWVRSQHHLSLTAWLLRRCTPGKRPLLSGNLVCWNTPSRTSEIFWPVLVLAWGRCLRTLDWEVRQVDRSRNHAAFPQQWPQQNSLRYLGSRHRYTQDYLTSLQITEKAASSKNEIPG